MAVEAFNVVVSALAAGGVAGVKDTASTMVKNAYAGLQDVVRRRFGRAKADELDAIANAHPGDENAAREQLAAALDGVEIHPNDELVLAASALLAQVDPHHPQVANYTVDARYAQGVLIGQHGQINIHNQSPRHPD